MEVAFCCCLAFAREIPPTEVIVPIDRRTKGIFCFVVTLYARHIGRGMNFVTVTRGASFFLCDQRHISYIQSHFKSGLSHIIHTGLTEESRPWLEVNLKAASDGGRRLNSRLMKKRERSRKLSIQGRQAMRFERVENLQI